MDLDQHSRRPRPLNEVEADSPRKLQLFWAGASCLGVFEEEIAAIADWREPTPLPNSPPAIRGVVSIHGRMLTVLNPLTLLGDEDVFAPERIIALGGDEQLALAIEGLDAVISIKLADVTASPEPVAGALIGVIDLEGRSVRVLDPRQLFSAAIHGRERRRRRF